MKPSELFEKMEDLHIKYEVTLVRHRAFTDVERLIEVFESLSEPVKRAISVMRDHKGCLSVLWRHRPNIFARDAVERAWQMVEDGSPVGHGWIEHGADPDFDL
jgi:hypothetical protein